MNKRHQLEDIARRIALGKEVSFSEMELIQKWARHNHSINELLRKARRRMIQGEPEPGTLDDFLDRMNLGTEHPADHLTADSSPDDIADFFRSSRDLRRD